ncbi:MAG: peptidoglycan-binding protein [Acidimicrobiales bacterium]
MRELQAALGRVGNYAGPDDGIYGPLTERAVREFQAKAGLHEDGIVGRLTWARLERATKRGLRSLTDELHGASAGEDVRQAQEMLRAAGFDPGPIDGVFGPRTEAAVTEFQSSRGLPATQGVDDATWAALAGPRQHSVSGSATGPRQHSVSGSATGPTQSRVGGSATDQADSLTSGSATTGPADLSWFALAGAEPIHFSDGAQQILQAASELVAQRSLPEGALPDADLIVVAALQRASIERRTDVSAPLLQWIAQLQYDPAQRDEVALVQRLVGTRDIQGTDPALWNERIRAVLTRAVDFATKTLGRPNVHIRHLLAAALCDPDSEQSLGAILGVPPAGCRTQLRREIARFIPDEAPDAWGTILLRHRGPAADGALAGGFDADVVRRHADRPLKDQLNTETYVQMLAGAIARRATRMPLSIGLFGEWGAGKSYFMLLLRQAVTELAQKGPASTFCADIVHIEFNAWHYSDANLWASLADEIFEQLAAPGEDTADKRPEELRKELARTSQRRQELEESAEGAERRVAELRAELDKALGDRKASAGAMALQLAKNTEVKDWLKKSKKELGFDVPEDRFRQLAEELFGAAGEAGALWKALGRRPWRLASALMVLVVLLTGGALVVPARARSWSGAGAVVALTALAGQVAVAVGRVRSGLGSLRQAVERADELEVAALRSDMRGEDKEMADALVAAEARVQVVRSQLEEISSQVGQLGRELAALEPGRRLYRFIAERATSDDYRRQLGIVSMIRKDFEKLVELMLEWRKTYDDPDSAKNPNREGRRPIDRIVLYIDDLDRCSPEQVVNVLQAVHLLGALDLFVVVVGVDPRWLLQSLRQEYRGILATADRPGLDGPGWQSTPQNYLEKIFNIPFVLPAMDSGGFATLLQGMAKPPNEEAGGADPASTAPVVEPPGPDPVETAATSAGQQPAAIVAARGSEVEAEITGHEPDLARSLEDFEVTFLTRLAALVRTPRSAKRMFNLYRIMRSTRSLAFLDGEYQVMAQLLAILTGYPELVGPLLYTAPVEDAIGGGLLHRPPHSSWLEFVAALTPVPSKPGESKPGEPTGWSSDVVGPIDAVDVGSWTGLAKALTPVLPAVTVDELLPYQETAPQIIRFSFLLSPFAAGAPAAAAPPPGTERTMGQA